jgi:hypothetical protein
VNIPVLNATSFQRSLSSGRTKPCLFFCENESNDINGEYVVKLKAGMENRENGLIAELIASQLANFLDIPTPEAAIINIDPLMAEVIPDPALSLKIKGSAGLNFGSKVITGGFDTWPVGKAIPLSLKPLAAEIFAFDAMIQNPDRGARPNILWRGDELYIIDHEMGFSFIYEILPLSNPWQITSLGFLKDHLFYGNLKGQSLNIDRFAGALELFSDGVLEMIVSNIPEEWRNHNITKMTDHINEILKHINDFIDEVRRILQ